MVLKCDHLVRTRQRERSREEREHDLTSE